MDSVCGWLLNLYVKIVYCVIDSVLLNSFRILLVNVLGLLLLIVVMRCVVWDMFSCVEKVGCLRC